MASDVEHLVQEGDCLSKIGKHYGFTWKTIWDYGPNSALRSTRKDPNLLLPGDIVRIPKKQIKSESKALNAKHKFKKKKEMPQFQIRLLFEGKPIRNISAELSFASPSYSASKKGKTDADGNLLIDSSKNIRIPPDAHGGILTLGEEPGQLRYNLIFSALPDHQSEQGAVARLFNLGYLHSAPSGTPPQDLASAVTLYQKTQSIEATGKVDTQLKTLLKSHHGS